jgi:hypothetical protein
MRPAQTLSRKPLLSQHTKAPGFRQRQNPSPRVVSRTRQSMSLAVM